MRFFLVLSFSLRLLLAGPETNKFGVATPVLTDDGATLNCWVSGSPKPSRSPVLFVPGYLMPGSIFEYQIDHFAKDRLVVAMDPRSQGRSAQVSFGHNPARRARDIKTVIDTLRLTNAVVVGWSFAALEVLSMIEQFGPQSLGGAVLIDGDLSCQIPENECAGELAFLSQVAGLFRTNRLPALKGFVQSMYRRPVDPEHLNRIVKSAQATSEDTGLALLVARLGFHVKLENIDLPVLVAISAGNPKRDRIAADARRMKRAEVHTFEECGHAVFVDDRERFNLLLEDFLHRVDSADHSPNPTP